MMQGPRLEDFETGTGKSRDDLLAEAAAACDNLANRMGAGGGQAAPDEASIRLREFRQDEARFSERPEVYALSGTEAFAQAKLPMPIQESAYSSRNDYYLVGFPFDLQPAGPYKFNELKVRVDFTAEHENRSPKVQGMFPAGKLQEMLKADLNLEVSIKPDVGFEVKTGQVELSTGAAGGPGVKGSAEVGGAAKGEAAFGVGPMRFRWNSALVTTSQPGLEWVWWQIGGTELHSEQSPRLMVILQVPHDAGAISASGQMEVRRNYRLFSRAVRNLTQLPQIYREFIEAGVPLRRGPVSWKGFLGA
ncbi:MAG TPA: hypothetical protein VH640_20950 [Bryobacteraceae bacterium]|jgi:hypothetical protein